MLIVASVATDMMLSISLLMNDISCTGGFCAQ